MRDGQINGRESIQVNQNEGEILQVKGRVDEHYSELGGPESLCDSHVPIRYGGNLDQTHRRVCIHIGKHVLQ